jgi:predicted nuclease of predicted toxin-antitoxin system
MRFLADESCDFAVVKSLRALGHDVLAVSEFQQRSVDSELMELAYTDGRILLTEDKDFGWLAFAAHLDNAGVILIRFPASARKSLAASIAHLVAQHGPKLAGSFIVVQPGSVRISKP